MDVKKLPHDRKKLIACDECGGMFQPQAVTEISVKRAPYRLYLCPGCRMELAGLLRGEKRAAG